MRNFSLSSSTPGITPVGAGPAGESGFAPVAGHDDGSAFETFGEKLSRLRKARCWTQSDLARQLGVSEASVCYWEQNRSRPKPARLESLGALLGAPIAELLGHASPSRVSDLGAMVARMRSEIAQAAGTSPAKVKIVIEM
ncbi:MAG TPA: helix-turn-helix transcriptional regulator [Sphingopyxis sp.]|nr:helix-turn-helix transcriptional regulator [Sphingopyxis sp.]